MKPSKFYILLILLGLIVLNNSCRKATAEIDNPSGINISLIQMWHLASTPLKYSESGLVNDLRYGFNRAHVAWYFIDPLFQIKTNLTPSYLTNDDFSDDYTRKIYSIEIGGKDTNTFLYVMNIAYYPLERGTYNYDNNGSEYSKGLNSSGQLNNPETRWAGIQRSITPSFQKVTYIEFWMMDPFIYDNNINGDFYIDIGDINEDFLRDNYNSDESAPCCYDDSCMVYSVWWKASTEGINYINENDRGLDGLNDDEEKDFFSNYLSHVRKIIFSNEVYDKFESDPSNDDFHYFLGIDYETLELSILDSYKKYNGLENNMPKDNMPGNYLIPDKEDMNYNGSIDTSNNYAEYHIVFNTSEFKIGRNFIDQIVVTHINLPNSKDEMVNWYHFKIPVESYESYVGQLNSAYYPKYIRIYLTNFKETVIFRIDEILLSYKVIE